MSEFTYTAPDAIRNRAYFKSLDEYQALYDESYENTDEFWAKIGNEYIDWFKPFDKVREYNYHEAEIKFYLGGKTNICYNCVDRHLDSRGDQTAIIWEGNTTDEDKKITFRELHEQVSKFGNVLKANGVKKGDLVTLYMPMVPELAVAMLACTRIGAVHSIVFGGFSADSLGGRIDDCQSTVIVCTDGLYRGAKQVPMKSTVDAAVKDLACVEKVICYKRTGEDVAWTEGRDVWWDDEMAKASADCPCEEMDAEDPLFILYTSGSTGKPKGVLHTTAGYNVYTAFTHKNVFDYHDGDIYWCTADIGWVTGHSYIIYGPLTNGATTMMFEGVPTFPDAGRFWQICDKWQVNIFYTAPTAIRALAAAGLDFVEPYKLDSLRLLGTVGEPINPEAWMWYWENIGKKKSADRRHLVADRNRRYPDHAATRRHAAEAGIRDAAVLRHQAGHPRSADRCGTRRRLLRRAGDQGAVAGADARCVR